MPTFPVSHCSNFQLPQRDRKMRRQWACGLWISLQAHLPFKFTSVDGADMATRVEELRNNVEAAKNPVLANARILMVSGRTFWQNGDSQMYVCRFLSSAAVCRWYGVVLVLTSFDQKLRAKEVLRMTDERLYIKAFQVLFFLRIQNIMRQDFAFFESPIYRHMHPMHLASQNNGDAARSYLLKPPCRIHPSIRAQCDTVDAKPYSTSWHPWHGLTPRIGWMGPPVQNVPTYY